MNKTPSKPKIKTTPAPFDPDAPAVHDGLYGLPFTPEAAKVVIIPVPWEATVSYGTGTAKGPAAVLAASRQVDLFDLETGKPYAAGIAMLPISKTVAVWNREARRLAAPVIKAGGAEDNPRLQKNLAAVNGLGEQMNGWVYSAALDWLEKGKLVGLLGGDHATPYGLIKAVIERHPQAGILHLDAHADLRDAYEGFTWSHASIMFNVMENLPVRKLVQAGIRDFGEREFGYILKSGSRISTFFDSEIRRQLLAGRSFAVIAAAIVEELPPEVYLSFDIDGLDPVLCPHTGTPVAGGFSFAEACFLMRAVVDSGRRIVGFDLNEVTPGPRGDEWDANVAARLLYKQIGFALLSQKNNG